MLPKDSLRPPYICLSTDILKWLLNIIPYYISNWLSRSSYIFKLVNHSCILPYLFLITWYLLVSIALTITDPCSACLFDFRVGRINQGSFGVALTSHSSGFAGSSMPLSCSISESMSAAASTSLSFGLTKSQFYLSQFSVSEIPACALSSSLSTAWQLILLIQWTFNIWIRPPVRSIADKVVAKVIFLTI